jgi:hypothetical protein
MEAIDLFEVFQEQVEQAKCTLLGSVAGGSAQAARSVWLHRIAEYRGASTTGFSILDAGVYRLLEKIVNRLDEMRASVTQAPEQEHEPLGEWMDDSSLCRMLGISRRTALNYRSKKLLPYTRVCGKIMYKTQDITKILEDGYGFHGEDKD